MLVIDINIDQNIQDFADYQLHDNNNNRNHNNNGWIDCWLTYLTDLFDEITSLGCTVLHVQLLLHSLTQTTQNPKQQQKIFQTQFHQLCRHYSHLFIIEETIFVPHTLTTPITTTRSGGKSNNSKNRVEQGLLSLYHRPIIATEEYIGRIFEYVRSGNNNHHMIMYKLYIILL
jgi:hypothetical protein